MRSASGRRQLGRRAARRALTTVQRRLRGPRSPAQVLAEVTTPQNLVTLEAVRAVVTLGIPDLVASGVTGVDELAVRAGANADALQRVLHHLAERELILETGPGRVELTDAGRLLVAGHPDSRNAAFQLGMQFFEAALREMLHSIRTGEPAFERANGAPPWRLMAQHPQMAASFDNDMNVHARSLAPELLAAYDWSGLARLVDVGGGSGELLRQLLPALPGVEGTIVEYADAATRAAAAVAGDPALAGRCTVVESTSSWGSRRVVTCTSSAGSCTTGPTSSASTSCATARRRPDRRGGCS